MRSRTPACHKQTVITATWWRGRQRGSGVMRLVVALLLLAGARAAGAQRGDTLVVGTYAYATVDRDGAVRPLAMHLAARLGRPTRVVTAPDPVALAHAVRRGEVDVAVTNTFGYLLLADGATPATGAVAALAAEEHDRQVAARGAGGAMRFVVLWRSPDIRLGPVAVRASLPATVRDSIAAAVVGLERDAPAAFDALRGGWTEARKADAMVPASDRTYDDVRQLFGSGAAAAALIARFAR